MAKKSLAKQNLVEKKFGRKNLADILAATPTGPRHHTLPVYFVEKNKTKIETKIIVALWNQISSDFH